MEETFDSSENATLSPCIAWNITDDTDMESKNMERIISIVVPTIFAFVVAFGFIGNLLVIIVVLSNKHMRNTTNVLITNLAITDLSFILICVPFTAVRYSVTVWTFGRIWCKVIHFVIYCTAWASVYTLVLMSFDRYLAVVHAISSTRIRTARNATGSIIVMWLIILLINIPTWMSHDVDEYYYSNLGSCEKRVICVFVTAADPNDYAARVRYMRVYYTCFLVFGFLLPLSLVCVLYGFMLHRLLYGVPRLQKSSKSSESQRSKKRVTRLIIIVVSFFTICWLPVHVMLMRASYFPKEPTVADFIWTVSANILAFMNSCVNPIIYAFLSKHFRRGFQKVIFCKTFTIYNSQSRTSAKKPFITSPTVNGREKETYEHIHGKTFTTAL